ncbi:MAG: OprO/OprP family phosphate-selective porin [Verrucomicrobiaceae bacterium]|nr:OprO/OprP family phosphate-selective porin [Verrucomicrobiaceae bacterium]
MRPRLPLIVAVAVLIARPGAVAAGEIAAEAASKDLSGAVGRRQMSVFDQVWNATELYRDESNPIVQDLDITGRFHDQYHWSEGGAADDDGWESRRFRIGLEARVLHDFTLKAEMTSAPDFDPFFNGFSALAIQWHPADSFLLTVGKQPARFTWDYSTSSNLHPYVERSQLLNEFAPDRSPAISMQGKAGRLNWYAALVSNTPDREVSREFGTFDGGASIIATLGYDLAEVFRTDAADVRLEYLHSEHNERSTIYNRFDDCLATSLVLREGRASVVTELLAGLGGDHGDAVGLNLMPGWFVNEKLELVARYQIALSDGAAGLTAQRRYERPAGIPSGDLYQAAYAGFNWFIYGPRLRLMGGVEYAGMNGHDAWTALLGVRLYWGPDSRTAFPVAYPYMDRRGAH